MIRLLIDENVHGAIISGLRRRQPESDFVAVQDVGLRQADDDVILEWAAANDRILDSFDRATLPVEAWRRVSNNLAMPGVMLLRPALTIAQAIAELEVVTEAGLPEDFRNLVLYLPL